MVDNTASLTIDDVLRPEVDARFTPYKRGRLLFGDQSVWIKMVVQPQHPGAQEWWLEVTPASVEAMTLYQLLPDGNMHTAQAGKNLPFVQRDIPYRHVVFRLKFADNTPQVLYLKTTSQFTGVRQLLMWQPSVFQEKVVLAQLGWGFYLGVCLLLVVASIWFERAVRDGVYRAFALFVLSCLIMVMATSGLLYQYVVPLSDSLLTIPFATLTSLVGYFFGVDFYFRFVGLHKTNPRLTCWYLWFVRITTVLLAIGVMSEYGVLARKIMIVMISFVYAPSALIILWNPFMRSGSEIKISFMITNLVFGIMLIFNYFVSMGYVHVSGIVEHRMPIVLLLIFLVIYYAISKRYKRMRHEKELAQHEKMLMMVRDERERAQQVADRTRDLQVAMQEVEKALSMERSAYEEQKNFLAMVSHELRTPLAVIDATAYNMVRETPAHAPQMQHGLKAIQQATEKLSELVSDQLGNTRLDTVSDKANLQETPLLPLFEDAVTAVTPLAGFHTFIIASPLLQTIYADASLMRLILRALLDHVVKETPAGTTVWLDASSGPLCSFIDISDSRAAQDGQLRATEAQPAVLGQEAAEFGVSLAHQLIAAHQGELIVIQAGEFRHTYRIALPHKVAQNGLSPVS